MDQTRMLLVDGHSMAFRAFFALPAESFSDGRGQATNAVYGFTNMLFNVVTTEKPTHVAVAFDLPGGTFRDRIYDQYKAGRASTPPEFIGQIELIQRVLDALGVCWLTAEDHEADDVVATLARRISQRGGEVLVCTSDRDAIQLVDDQTTVLQPRKGVTDLVRMTPQAVWDKYGVTPQQYPELAALVGESADNLPGVPGVGPKTAAKWIGMYGSLEQIVARAEEIKGKAGQSLRDHLDDVERNRRMNAAVTTLDLPDDDALYRLGRGSRQALAEVFDNLAFHTIRQRVPDLFLADAPEAPAAPSAPDSPRDVTKPLIDSGDGLIAALTRWRADGGAVVATGTWEQGAGDAHHLAIAGCDGVAVVALSDLTSEAEKALAAWLSDPEIPLTAHDAKRVAHLMASRGMDVCGVVMDLGIAEFLCRPDQRPATIAQLALRHLHEDIEAEVGASEQLALDLDGESVAAQATALARQADAVARVGEVLAADVAARGAENLLETLELPLQSVIADMEAIGIATDDTVLSDLDAAHAQRQREVAEAAFAEIGGDRINLGSPKQLQEVLFTRLDMPKTRKTKTGYSTDAESLTDLFARTGHPFLEHLLAHRDVTKMRQIIETLRKSIADDGRIHTTFHQNIAATGRLSSNSPNLQNIPARTAEGRRIREAFRCSDGFDTLMTADYSQIEMRIMAHLCGDEGLIEAFRSGEDLHVFVASRVFGVAADEVDSAMRSKTKAVSYGLAYGLSAFGLARQLHISQTEATALRDGYFERFGKVRDYLRASVETAREKGYTETILGRRRYLPDLGSDNRQRRENAERVALNSPIQGSAADIIKLAMLGVQRELTARALQSRMLLQVHDELVLDIAPGEESEVRQLVVEQMGGAYDLSVPLEVSVGTGPTWAAAAH
ncbi:DNA polymerase I [Devriesea agamarum]|uniref:DNA polymerase I n=1 Tax=Devriesea agamarum TaxID=472569 RepID=UPI00071CC4F1|nr:DNA polymerase I [Devriesea agamarum]